MPTSPMAPLERIDGVLVLRCPTCGGIVAQWDPDRVCWITGAADLDVHGNFECPNCSLFSCPLPPASAVTLFELAQEV